VLCLAFIVFAIRSRAVLVSSSSSFLPTVTQVNHEVFLRVVSTSGCPFVQRSWLWGTPQRTSTEHYLLAAVGGDGSLFIAADTWQARLPSSRRRFVRFFRPFGDITKQNLGFLCTWACLTQHPSVLELSQFLNGLFLCSVCLSCFIQAPPLGFKERGSQCRQLHPKRCNTRRCCTIL